MSPDVMRRVLEEANARMDYSKPIFQAQIAAVDMVRLHADLDRLALRALVLTHAFEVMHAGSHPHPMQAFMHAVDCEGPISDTEFFAVLRVWAKLCQSPEPVVVGGLSSQDFGSVFNTFDGKDR